MNNFKQEDFCDVEQIGDGGEGVVFRARNKDLDIVAIKVFNRRKGNMREIENMRKFSQHPNIIDFLGTVEIEGFLSPQIGYAMKYMPQGSVHDVIHVKKIPYSLDTARKWILQAATAISYLHENNVIHRDIKPANMLLSDCLKTVYISDFGLAKACARNNGLTSFQGSTYPYMAPEIFQNLSFCSKSSDVFSFAISIWEIGTKRFPYEDNPDIIDDLSLRTEVLKGTRPSLPKHFDPYLTELLENAWSSNPNIRPSLETIVDFFNDRNLSSNCEPHPTPEMQPISIQSSKKSYGNLSAYEKIQGFNMHRNVTGADGTEFTLFFLGCFGNYWKCDVLVIDNRNYLCTEQYYTYAKAMEFKDYETANKILNAISPGEMRKLGRHVSNFNEYRWAKPSINAMITANVHKYMQSPVLRKALESTSPRTMVEAVPNDRIWGIGWGIDTPQATDRSQWRGRNYLGRILDAIRDALLSNQWNTPEEVISVVKPMFDSVFQ